eukprot:Nk52_evm22s262 gene=Nk52_evmTU22s262
MSQIKNKSCLIVIDGWGISPNTKGNAVANAKTPCMTALAKEYQHVPVAAHGLHVGLPDGLMGNSEVGHMNVGAGRVVFQDIVRIDLAMKNRDIYKNENFLAAIRRAKEGNGRLHLLGLVSDGGVHSHIEHLKVLLDVCKTEGVPDTFVQYFADGRDTPPQSTTKYCKELLDHMDGLKYGKLATVTGRYYAMDRDKRWERIQLAYDGMVKGEGEATDQAGVIRVIEQRYASGENDEFLKPIIVNEDGVVKDSDTLVFFDFRADRMREIAETFGIGLNFESKELNDLSVYSLTQYKKDFPFPCLFPPQSLDNVMAEWLAKKGVTQFHTAETEKYAHVTFFFNGGCEQAFENEAREMVPSPKVATYDLQPEMNADGVAESVVRQLDAGVHPFVMCNFAPPDMVGHTGMYEPAIKGVEATDAGIAKIWEGCKRNGYTLFVTADHGNAEQMLDATTGNPHTAHTCNPVPFIMAIPDGNDKASFSVDTILGKERLPALCDVAPTVLKHMGLEIPSDMDGKALF